MINESSKTITRRILDSQGAIMGSKKINKHELGMSGVLLFLMIFLASCVKNDTGTSDGNTDKILVEETNVKGSLAHLTTNDSVHHIVNHSAFKGFSQYLLPWDNSTNYYNTPLNNVSSLLPYHNHVDPYIVV